MCREPWLRERPKVLGAGFDRWLRWSSRLIATQFRPASAQCPAPVSRRAFRPLIFRVGGAAQAGWPCQPVGEVRGLAGAAGRSGPVGDRERRPTVGNICFRSYRMTDRTEFWFVNPTVLSIFTRNPNLKPAICRNLLGINESKDVLDHGWHGWHGWRTPPRSKKIGREGPGRFLRNAFVPVYPLGGQGTRFALSNFVLIPIKTEE